METKRCVYCHKLQRADAQSCSRCGHAFVQKKTRPSRREWTQPSIPPASPHRAGHYSGLHPEDQPYQSNKIVVQYPISQESDSWHAGLPEPRHIVLPDTDPALRGRNNIPGYYDERPAEEVSAPGEPFFYKPGNYKPRRWLLPRRAIAVLLTLSCIFFLLASSILAVVLVRKYTSMPGMRITKSSTIALTATTGVEATSSITPRTPTTVPETAPVPATTLTINPTTLSFPLVVGEEPVLKAIIMYNSSNQPLNWSATVSTTDHGSWLSADPPSGLLGAGIEGHMNADVNVQGMVPGSYQGTLTLSPGTGGMAQQVTILLTVS